MTGPGRDGRIVVGVSTSLAGLEAIRYGVAEARRRHLSLYAVPAWRRMPPWRGPEVHTWREEILLQTLRYVSEAFDTAMGGPPADLDVVVVASEGRPEDVLTAVARDRRDLLVVGGRTGWLCSSRLVRRCVRHPACPVTVVPPPELARAAGGRSSIHMTLREATWYGATTSWRSRDTG